MRTLHDHKLNGLNDALDILVLDEPGHGGACHSYQIVPTHQTPVDDLKTLIFTSIGEASMCWSPRPTGEFSSEEASQVADKLLNAVGSWQRSCALCEIYFQNGPINEHGVNGISGEALLAVNIDRLRGFQAGQYACADNAEALDHLEKALECLHRRTKERLARGVEGTSIK
jgi:hypothetical protein